MWPAGMLLPWLPHLNRKLIFKANEGALKGTTRARLRGRCLFVQNTAATQTMTQKLPRLEGVETLRQLARERPTIKNQAQATEGRLQCNSSLEASAPLWVLQPRRAA